MSKRILKDIKELQTEKSDLFKLVEPIDALDLLYIEMNGPKDSPYENGVFFIEVFFPKEYPFTPPKLNCLTKIFHPNIDTDGGICFNILNEQWSPLLSLYKVLISLYTLLDEPNPYDALNKDCATLMIENKDEYIKLARRWTKRYARREKLESNLEELLPKGN